MIKGRTRDGKVGVVINEDKNTVSFNREVIKPADNDKEGNKEQTTQKPQKP